MKRLLSLAILGLVGAVPARCSGTNDGAKKAETAAQPFDVSVAGIKKDPLLLVGEYIPAKTDEAPVLVMLHGLGSTQGEWAPLIAAASARGWGTYAYDARGHGRSKSTLSGAAIDHEDRRTREKPEFWTAMIDDLKSVVASLERQKSVGRRRIYCVGASLGANVALAASSGTLGGLVLLSPGLNYAGIESETPLLQVQAPVLILAAKPDPYSYVSVQRLAAIAPKDRRIDIWTLDQGTEAGAHGTQLFDGKLEKRILDWVAETAKEAQKAARGAKESKPKR